MGIGLVGEIGAICMTSANRRVMTYLLTYKSTVVLGLKELEGLAQQRVERLGCALGGHGGVGTSSK